MNRRKGGWPSLRRSASVPTTSSRVAPPYWNSPRFSSLTVSWSGGAPYGNDGRPYYPHNVSGKGLLPCGSDARWDDLRYQPAPNENVLGRVKLSQAKPPSRRCGLQCVSGLIRQHRKDLSLRDRCGNKLRYLRRYRLPLYEPLMQPLPGFSKCWGE